MTEKGRRWPRWVYSVGEEPDYRFSFANERTFLAWIRTSLALLAAAVAIDVVELDMSDAVRRVLASLLVVLGVLSAVFAFIRWALAERAIRRRHPLPSVGFAVLLSLALAVAGLTGIVMGY